MTSKFKFHLLSLLATLLYFAGPAAWASNISFTNEGCTQGVVGGGGYCQFYVTASNGSVEFSLGSNSPWQVTNSSNGSWSVSGGDGGRHTACTGGFSGFTLSSGQSCGFTAYFYPTTAGTTTGTFQIINWAIAPVSNPTYALSGTSVSPTASITITGLSCPSTPVGGSNTCSASSAMLSTNGTSFVVNNPPATISTGDFSIAAGSCGGTVYYSCNLGAITFHPITVGTRNATASPSTNLAVAATAGLTGIGTAGTAVVSVAGVTCAASAGFTSTCSGTATISASSGPIVLNANPVALSGTNASEFTVAAGGCANASLSSGAFCNLGAITFSPLASGTRTVTLTASASSGSNGTGVGLSGTASAAGTASVSSFNCPTTTLAGSSSSCAGTLTVSAVGGSIKLGSPAVYTTAGATSSFVTSTPSSGACTTGQILSTGGSCNVLTVSSFTPAATGALAETVTVTPLLGGAGSGSISGTGASVTLNPASLSCGTTVGVGSNASCGNLTLTANGAPVTLGTTPVVLSDASNFSIAASTCSAGAVLPAAGTCTVTVLFRPQSSGAKSTSVTVNTNFGTPSATASGTGVYGAVQASPASLACGTAAIGSSSTCSTGTITLSTTQGPVTLSASPFSASDSLDFTVPAGNCANLTLQVGQQCTSGSVLFTPRSAGALASTITVNTTAGTGTSFSLSGTGTYGTPTLDNAASCPNTGAGNSVACSGLITLTATGGPLSLSASPVTLSNATDFTIASNTCTGNLAMSSGQTCAIALTFNPHSLGTASSLITFNTNNGNPSTSLSGVGLAGALQASTSSISCPATTSGATASCGSVTLTAQGGPVTLSAVPVGIQDSADFSIGGTCAANQVLASGATCSVSVGFQPTTAGALSTSITVNTTSGSGTSFSASGSAYSYIWNTGPWGPSSNTCSSVASQSRAVSCVRSDGVTVPSGCTGIPPSSTQTLSDFSGCTYAWQTTSFGSCNGGAGTWSYGAWTPDSGCGSVEQSRSSTCVVNPDSGVASRDVSCVRADGAVVEDASCDPAARPTSQTSCTPTTGFSCGASDITSQSVILSNACTYHWQSADWGDCTGGTASWVYTDWTPAIGSACTQSLTQTRSATCTADAGSGAKTRSVLCMSSNNSVVDDAFCSGSKPETTQTCSPAAPTCDTQEPLTQVVEDPSTCSYTWTAGGFGNCTGNGAWSYTAWTPSSGCGVVTQSRDVISCDGTGVQTQAVACTRSDGTAVSNSECDPHLVPPTIQACAFTAANCPTPLTTQVNNLNNGCDTGTPAAGPGVTLPNCTPSSTSFCVVMPLSH